MLLGLAVVAALAVGAGSGHAAGFLEGTEDVPLMPGLNQIARTPLSFDSPGGRIVEVYAEGAPRPADILAFYTATLEQLGWQRIDATNWRREGEKLSLTIAVRGAGSAVRFLLAPQN